MPRVQQVSAGWPPCWISQKGGMASSAELAVLSIPGLSWWSSFVKACLHPLSSSISHTGQGPILLPFRCPMAT